MVQITQAGALNTAALVVPDLYVQSGRPRGIEFREVINAVRYLVRSGCGWRMLPVHFGHWRTVYGWFRELARRFLFQCHP